MNAPVKGTTESVTSDGEIIRILPDDVVARFDEMVAGIPDAGGAGMEGILTMIAAATRPEQLDAPWSADGLGEYVGKRLTVTGLRKMASEYDGGLPWYLIVTGTDQTGADFTATTGSVSVVGQLIRAHAGGWLPLGVIPRLARKPSANGYYPMHLDIVG